jgi:glucosyl-dolichyl phosphate glucuronosyltransferase
VSDTSPSQKFGLSPVVESEMPPTQTTQDGGRFDLSVVIPTRDRHDVLADCLATLSAQRTTANVEVIVMDDGSSEPVAPLVERCGTDRITFRTVRLSGDGLNVARNRGVADARADIISFLDDDTLVAEGWADGVLRAFSSTGCAGLAGRILLQYEGQRPSWLWINEHGYLSGVDRGEDVALVEDSLVPTGANCAVRREWFDRVGGFREGLDRKGTSLISGGDTEFFRRVVEAGGRITYSGEASVLHRVPPQRLTRRYFIKRGFNQGISDALMVGKPTSFSAQLQWWRMTAHHVARAPLIFAKNLVLRRGMLTTLTWCALCAGRFRAMTHWLRQGRTRSTLR